MFDHTYPSRWESVKKILTNLDVWLVVWALAKFGILIYATLQVYPLLQTLPETTRETLGWLCLIVLMLSLSADRK